MNVIIVDSGNKLWLGDFSAAEDVEQLKFQHIRMGTDSANAVITAAQGYYVQYDSSITHYSFNLQDIKTQNIMQYFDDAVKKITAGTRWLIRRAEAWGSAGALRGRGVEGTVRQLLSRRPL
jgi:hypothetical protein